MFVRRFARSVIAMFLFEVFLVNSAIILPVGAATQSALGLTDIPIAVEVLAGTTGVTSISTRVTCSDVAGIAPDTSTTILPATGGRGVTTMALRAQATGRLGSSCSVQITVNGTRPVCEWVIDASARSLDGTIHSATATATSFNTETVASFPASVGFAFVAKVENAPGVTRPCPPVPVDASPSFGLDTTAVVVRTTGPLPAGLTSLRLSVTCNEGISSAPLTKVVDFWPEGGAADVEFDSTTATTPSCGLSIEQVGSGFTPASVVNVVLNGVLKPMIPTAAISRSTSYQPTSRDTALIALNFRSPYLPAAVLTPLEPTRPLDTRVGKGAALGPVGAGQTLNVVVVGQGGVPASNVSAVFLNVTATGATASSFVTVYPSGEVRPNASNLNLAPGRTTPNLVLAKVGANGAISLYNDAGSTQLIADVMGWVTSTSPSPFIPLSPSRILDTRIGLGSPASPIGAGQTRDLVVAGAGGVPSTGAGTVVLNMTATSPTASTYITVWPTGTVRPNASSLNLAAGETVPNLVFARLGAGGTISLYNESGATHVIADVVGYIPASADYFANTPQRLVDTRSGSWSNQNSEFRFSKPVGAGESLSLHVRPRSPVTSAASAVVLNVTTTGATSDSYLSVYPSQTAPPNASNLNFLAGQTVANAVVAKIGVDGNINIYNSAGSTHVIVDLVGWLP